MDRFFFQMTNYQGFQNNLVNVYVLAISVQTKVKILRNFELQFWINQVLLYLIAGPNGRVV
jgi:hypothetical protein